MTSPAADPAGPLAPSVPVSVEGGPLVTAPVVAGARDGGEAEAVLVAAQGLGLVLVGRHDAGRGRVVLELTPPPGADPEAVRAAVRALRAAGWAVIDGPPSPAHALAWARRNAPTRFAPGAAVCFPWSPVDRSGFGLVVDIDPGAGFGAGGHPTTLGLLAGLVDPALQALIRRPVAGLQREPAAAPEAGGPDAVGPEAGGSRPVAPAGPGLAGLRVLDVGCGTGVLAVAAALAGAGTVGALDIAPEALAATKANAARNGMASRVRLLDADLAACPGPWDLVLANIHAEVLAALAPHLARLTAPGGLLGLGGLSPSQPSLLEAALRPMTVVRHDHHGDWVSLWLRHPGGGPPAGR